MCCLSWLSGLHVLFLRVPDMLLQCLQPFRVDCYAAAILRQHQQIRVWQLRLLMECRQQGSGSGGKAGLKDLAGCHRHAVL
jgi:hypothetical protein